MKYEVTEALYYSINGRNNIVLLYLRTYIDETQKF